MTTRRISCDRRHLSALGRIVAAVSVSAVAAGCQVLGFPRVGLAVDSPDGRMRAEVRNAPSIDPPQQSLWLRSRGGTAVELRRLAGDQDWCHSVVWSADSRRVAFLIQDVEAVVYDAASGRQIASLALAAKAAYPPDEKVEDLAFTPAGDSLTYRVCARRSDRCGEMVSSPLPAAVET